MRTLTRHRRLDATVRLLLVLVLTLAPLAGYAAAPLVVAGDTAGHGQDMPCHQSDPPAAAHADCAYCSGDHAAGPCACCGWVAPGALPGAALVTADPLSGLVCTLGTTRPNWPESPPNVPYRPPIALS